MRRPAAIGRRPRRRGPRPARRGRRCPTTSCSLPRMTVGRNSAENGGGRKPWGKSRTYFGRRAASLRNAIPPAPGGPPGPAAASPRTRLASVMSGSMARDNAASSRTWAANVMPAEPVDHRRGAAALAAGPSGRVLHREGQPGPEAGDQVLAEIEVEFLADPVLDPGGEFGRHRGHSPSQARGSDRRSWGRPVTARRSRARLRVSAAGNRRRTWAGQQREQAAPRRRGDCAEHGARRFALEAAGELEALHTVEAQLHRLGATASAGRRNRRSRSPSAGIRPRPSRARAQRVVDRAGLLAIQDGNDRVGLAGHDEVVLLEPPGCRSNCWRNVRPASSRPHRLLARLAVTKSNSRRTSARPPPRMTMTIWRSSGSLPQTPTAKPCARPA